jgi:hypothetical protein
LIVAFEVIEHLIDWRLLLLEARRVLQPDLFLVSTPNKEYYTDSRGASGPNPFHIHEFEFEEFQKALAEFFPHCIVLQQNHVEAFAFYENGSAGSTLEGRMDGTRGTARDAHFFLAVCSLQETPLLPAFLFVHEGSNVLREREKHIESLRQELREAHEQFAALHRHHDELTLHLERQNQWALRTGHDLTTALQHLNTAEATVVERTLWAQRLDAEVQNLSARLNLWRSSRWIKLSRKLNLGPDLDHSPIKGISAGGDS